jgi:hypothetical protein
MQPQTTTDLVIKSREILNLLDESQGEITEEFDKQFHALLEEFASKATALNVVHGRVKDELALIDDEIKRLQEYKKGLQNAQRRIKQYAGDLLTSHQEMTGETKIKEGRRTLYWMTTTSVVGPANIDDWPEEFVRVRKEENKAAVKQALKDGREINGFALAETKHAVFR